MPPSAADDDTTRMPALRDRLRGGLSLDDRLDQMEDLLREIKADLNRQNERLAAGDTKFEVLSLRIAGLEKVVYGLCAVVGVGVVGAVLALVIKGHP